MEEFPQLFCGLGKLEGAYSIKLRPDATPYSLCTPRHVAIPLLPNVKAELERMQDLGVITPVEEATDWCAGMVVVPKANGKVRICVDLTKLNESVCREKHPIPSVDQTLGHLAGAKYFSKLDANSGFWQIPHRFLLHSSHPSDGFGLIGYLSALRLHQNTFNAASLQY